MAFYEERVLPHLINLACGSRPIMRQRQKIIPHASGRVLEIGMGSAINLPLYDPDRVDMVWGLEPSHGMRRKAQRRVDAAPIRVEWLGLSDEEIPLEKQAADTIVLTYTLCTIANWVAAVREMRRVLKPGGRLLFSEHGAAPDARVRRWQDRINPVWRRLAGGCQLNRDIPGLLHEGGFQIADLQTLYLPKTPRFAGYNFCGHAR